MAEKYLLDNNVLSELYRLKKGNPKTSPKVRDWFASVPLENIFINTIVLLEQQKWVLFAVHRNDLVQAKYLQDWVNSLKFIFSGRIFNIDKKTALICAALHVPNPRPQHDTLIAATALAHDLILVTRNTKDFQNIDGLRIFNPFT